MTNEIEYDPFFDYDWDDYQDADWDIYDDPELIGDEEEGDYEDREESGDEVF